MSNILEGWPGLPGWAKHLLSEFGSSRPGGQHFSKKEYCHNIWTIVKDTSQYSKTIVIDIKDTKSTICWRARPNVKLMGEFSSTTGLQVFILNKYLYLPVFLILHFFIGHFYWPFLLGTFWLHIKYYKSNSETFQGCCRPSLSHSIGVVLQALQVILKLSNSA